MRLRTAIALAALLSVALVTAAALHDRARRADRAPAPVRAPVTTAAPEVRPEPPRADPTPWPEGRALEAGTPLELRRDVEPTELQWIAVGGGAEPASNQVQILQDLLLVRETLGPDRGLLLFGAGPGSQGVQVQDVPRRGDPLTNRLGELLDWRAGRDATYRRVPETVDGPADAGVFLDLVEQAVSEPGPPLVLWIAGHGEQGAVPADNAVRLWGGWTLTPRSLAESLRYARRPVRLVVTSCFSGGFAEVAFEDADPERGRAPIDLMGWFSTTWDREASGCDPNPDRGAQEGYAAHVLHALRGEDRSGRTLARDAVDLDGDGTVSFAEAHARARIEGTSLDVPTTMGERLLRAHLEVDRVAGHPDAAASPRPASSGVRPIRADGPARADRSGASGATKGAGQSEAAGAADALADPGAVWSPLDADVEREVIAALETRLDLHGPAAARRALGRLRARADHTVELLDEAQVEADDAWFVLTAALLARWPVLDDPWHPDFGPTLDHHRVAIEAFLAKSPEARAHARARSAVDELQQILDELTVRSAQVERLARAHRNLALLTVR